MASPGFVKSLTVADAGVKSGVWLFYEMLDLPLHRAIPGHTLPEAGTSAAAPYILTHVLTCRFSHHVLNSSLEPSWHGVFSRSRQKPDPHNGTYTTVLSKV